MQLRDVASITTAAAVAIVAAACDAVVIGSPDAQAAPRGVAPSDLALYKPDAGGVLWCRSDAGSMVKLHPSAINDGYCDCADGLDEPGTAACPRAKYYCENFPHTPAFISSAFVNDGVCDPLCCDGSDEYLGRIKCPNTCKKSHAEYVAAEKHLAQTRAAGSQAATLARERGTKVIADALAAVKLHNQQIKKLDADIKLQQYAVEKAQAVEKQRANVESKLGRLSQASLVATVGRLQSAINGVKDAVAKFKESTRDAAGTELLLAEHEKATVGLEELDILPLPHHDEIPALEQLTHWQRFVVVFKAAWDPDTQMPLARAKADVEVARKALQDMENLKRTSVTELELAKKISNTEFRGMAYAALYGSCFSASTPTHDFKLCPFDKVLQTESGKTHGEVTLGAWPGVWEDSKTWMLDHGDACHNGKVRSTRVSIECGARNEVFDFNEPSVCVYSARFRTPAACL